MNRIKTARSLSLICAMLILLSLICTTDAHAISEDKYYENAVVFWINTERARHGLAALKTSDALNRAANTRANEIQRSFSHVRPNGKSVDTVLDDCGIPALYVGENIAAGYSTPCEVVKKWMESSGHRNNILNSNFEYIGVGYNNVPGSVYGSYWTQLFVGMVDYPDATGSFYVAPTDLDIGFERLSLDVGEKHGFYALPEPDYATAPITCISSDKSVVDVIGAEVNVIGVQGVSDGTAVLSVSCGNITKHIIVTVGAGSAQIQMPEPTPVTTSDSPVEIKYSESFIDVLTDSPFYNAIYWASAQGIAAGYEDGSFRPDAACTRAHVLCFLWRAAGCPEPHSSVDPFTDLDVSSPFYKAILWGYYEGITTGVTATRFCPDDICTRAQIVTFLWRYYGRPGVNSYIYFTDTHGMNTDYTSAVSWAASNGITTGYVDGSFRPYSICTRGHIVTFLYRSVTGGI